MHSPKLAIQTRMWGVERIETDFPLIFNDVLEAGYYGVECRFNLVNDEEKLNTYLQQNPNLKIVALHILAESFHPDRPEEDLNALLDRMNRFGIQRLIVTLLKKDSLEEYLEWMEAISAMAKSCANKKIQLLYHNHDWEFDYGYQLFDVINKDPNMQLAADFAWIFRANYSFKEFIDRYRETIKYVHVKDTANGQWKELGNGDMDLVSLLDELKKLHLEWWTVEQDETDKVPLESAIISRKFLQNLGM
ncbi:sugar phosphate isomerase/epimerase [Neobacillus rhizosphaerae]|uniref:sugar phosphate isomerase/epimerase family protein n=1 Tax=Neobacillus rhizosphaerae TaxID=2880965 RepID=UPI003D2912B1